VEFVGAQTVGEQDRSNYAGDELCRACHETIANSYQLTAHHRTPKIANKESMAGSFAEGKNRLKTSDKDLQQRSRCYQTSGTMTCGTCHDLHESGKLAMSYTEKCLTCHKPENCGLYPKLGAKLAENCVDCHMPVQESEAIVSTVNGGR
jgi:hypothetical protein